MMLIHHCQHWVVEMSESGAGDRTSIMWTLMADGEATEAIGVVADIKRESKFSPKMPISTNLKNSKSQVIQGSTRLGRNHPHLITFCLKPETVAGEGEYTIPTSTVFGLSKFD